MHDPKFEQEVERKMRDLEFVPSDSVWAGIQQGIAPRERRRRVAIWWWWFPGALLLGGGVVMYRHMASGNGVAKVVPAVRSGKAGGGEGTSGVTGSGVTGSGTGAAVTGVGVAGTRDAGKMGGTDAGKTGGADVRKTDGVVAGEPVAGVGEGAAFARASAAGAVPEGRVSWIWLQPGLIGGLETRGEVSAPLLMRSVARPVNTAVTGIMRTRHPWVAGFAAGGGGSSILSGSGNTMASNAAYYGNSAYGNPASTPSRPYGVLAPAAGSSYSGGSKENLYDIKVNYSYWAGIYAGKQLTSRWAVDIGLNLHYYSVRFETNNPVSIPYAPSSASLFAATSITYTADSSNAGLGEEVKTYDNRYYYLEVPVTVQWRLDRGHSLPLFWRAGGVFSYLMSSNGLYYDYSSGAYAKDNGVVRRVQAGVTTGLMVGLPVRGLQIQAGPEVQYALTSMLTTGSGGGHMVYGGLRVALMR